MAIASRGLSENTLRARGQRETGLDRASMERATGRSNGLTIAQQGSQVFGLDIENFYADGVLITAGGNVQVAGCFIGTDPTGETAAPNGTGVVIENSFNTIGGPERRQSKRDFGEQGSRQCGRLRSVRPRPGD